MSSPSHHVSEDSWEGCSSFWLYSPSSTSHFVFTATVHPSKSITTCTDTPSSSLGKYPQYTTVVHTAFIQDLWVIEGYHYTTAKGRHLKLSNNHLYPVLRPALLNRYYFFSPSLFSRTSLDLFCWNTFSFNQEFLPSLLPLLQQPPLSSSRSSTNAIRISLYPVFGIRVKGKSLFQDIETVTPSFY